MLVCVCVYNIYTTGFEQVINNVMWIGYDSMNYDTSVIFSVLGCDLIKISICNSEYRTISNQVSSIAGLCFGSRIQSTD